MVVLLVPLVGTAVAVVMWQRLLEHEVMVTKVVIVELTVVLAVTMSVELAAETAATAVAATAAEVNFISNECVLFVDGEI
jgi:hypothetical protein